jgi:hypothetical protein
MFLKWLLSLFLFSEQLCVLAAAFQSPLRDPSMEDESLAVVDEPSYPASSTISPLLSCSLDMVDLKEVDYNTLFDGAYGSKFENAILTLCSDEGKQIPWKKTDLFEPSILDQVAEQCCSDILYGLDTVSLEDVHSVGFRSPWGQFFFFSAFVFCLLYIIKYAYERKR